MGGITNLLNYESKVTEQLRIYKITNLRNITKLRNLLPGGGRNYETYFPGADEITNLRNYESEVTEQLRIYEFMKYYEIKNLNLITNVT